MPWGETTLVAHWPHFSALVSGFANEAAGMTNDSVMSIRHIVGNNGRWCACEQ